ncbi:rhomboid family intramembrane serine protease [soil metagenome]
MFPIGDQNIPGRGLAYVTLAIIAFNVAIFVLLQLPDTAFTYGWSAVPAEITSGRDLVGVRIGPDAGDVLGTSPEPVYLTLLSSMFMHGGWLHLGGNMLFLWIFGDNIEHTMGSVLFVAFYLVAGLVASFAQILIDPDSIIPTLGASGAISGVMGAYLVLYPGNRVTVFVFRFLTAVPALVAIGMWAAFQFINGFAQIAQTEQTGGVAYMAHVGGFLAGVVAGLAVRTMGGRSRGFRSAH